MTTPVGSTFETIHGLATVIEVINRKNIKIMFHDPIWETVVRLEHLLTGKVKNKMFPLSKSKEFIGDGYFNTINAKEAYFAWKNMFRRVYKSSTIIQKRAYGDVEICQEWLNFQNYAEWYYNQINQYSDWRNVNFVWQVDKDLTCFGNKTYCPEKCVILPNAVNAVLINSTAARGTNPIGLIVKPKGFEVRFSEFNRSKTVGFFEKECDARMAYWEAKFQSIHAVARFYQKYIPPKLFNRLVSFGLSDAIEYYGLDTVIGQAA